MMECQWEITNVREGSYSIRNVATQRYLGMKRGGRVSDDHELYEVDHAFIWDICETLDPPMV